MNGKRSRLIRKMADKLAYNEETPKAKFERRKYIQHAKKTYGKYDSKEKGVVTEAIKDLLNDKIDEKGFLKNAK